MKNSLYALGCDFWDAFSHISLRWSWRSGIRLNKFFLINACWIQTMSLSVKQLPAIYIRSRPELCILGCMRLSVCDLLRDLVCASCVCDSFFKRSGMCIMCLRIFIEQRDWRWWSMLPMSVYFIEQSDWLCCLCIWLHKDMASPCFSYPITYTFMHVSITSKVCAITTSGTGTASL